MKRRPFPAHFSHQKQKQRFFHRLYRIKEQMASSNPIVRERALAIFDEMVERDLRNEQQHMPQVKTDTLIIKREDIQEDEPVNQPVNVTLEETSLERRDVDVMQKIRFMQKDKQNKLKRRKKRWFVL